MPDTSPGFVIDLETRRRLSSDPEEPHRALSAEQVYEKLDATQKDARASIAVAREAVNAAKAAGATAKEALDEVAETKGAVLRLEGLVGQPGDPKALQRASIQDMTADEIIAAEVGTGLIGAVNRGHMRDEQVLRRIAKAAGTSASIKTIGGAFATGLATYGVTHIPEIVDSVRHMFGG